MWTNIRFSRLLFALALGAAVAMGLASGMAYSADGDLDLTLDSDGLVTTNFNNTLDEARAVTIQADGKIVAVGTTYVSDVDYDFSVARFNPDGTLDTTFGDGNGKVIYDFYDRDDRAYAVAVQPDGNIVVVGTAQAPAIGYPNFFTAMRLLPDGTPDISFGDNGSALYRFNQTVGSPSTDSAFTVALQPDGKIVISGYTIPDGGTPNFGLMRLNPDGSLDDSFDGDGKLSSDFFGGVDEVHSVAIQPDGKILAAGFAQVSGFNYDVALARYNPNGSLDSTFGGDGKVTTDFFGGDDGALSMFLQSDGKIVAAGAFYSTSQGYDFGIVRYLPNGDLDTSFDNDGLQAIYFVTGTATEVANGVVVQPTDGKIVVAGYAPVGGINDFALVRLNPDGTLDSSFGVGGRVNHDFGGGVAIAYGVTLQADGKIVTAGNAYMNDTNHYDFALARYKLGDEPIPTPTPTPIPSTLSSYLPLVLK